MIDDIDHYRIKPGQKVKLSAIPTDDDGKGLDKDKAVAQLAALHLRMDDLQEKLYASGTDAVLFVFQAMDAAGKDSTTRKVFGPLNPQGVRVSSFKAPTAEELGHDFLWRVHRECPRHGMIRVFNRSHYEDVLIVRVKKFVPESVWKKRYDQINAFEELLHHGRTHVVKFFLHISKDYQKQRFQRRLEKPDKLWKFNPGDLVERARWDDYMHAYEDVLERCSTQHAPWYVIPAETRWYRDLLVASIVTRTLESIDMKMPEPDFDPATIVID